MKLVSLHGRRGELTRRTLKNVHGGKRKMWTDSVSMGELSPNVNVILLLVLDSRAWEERRAPTG